MLSADSGTVKIDRAEVARSCRIYSRIDVKRIELQEKEYAGAQQAVKYLDRE